MVPAMHLREMSLSVQSRPRYRNYSSAYFCRKSELLYPRLKDQSSQGDQSIKHEKLKILCQTIGQTFGDKYYDYSNIRSVGSGYLFLLGGP